MGRRHVEFFDALVRYEIVLWNALDEALQVDLGLTLARLEALRVLHRRKGTCRVQDIADDLSITVGAASKLVDRLENDGLAQRGTNPYDRRSSLITLTVGGRSVHDRGARHLERRLRAHLSGSFDPEELTMITNRLVSGRDQLRHHSEPAARA